MKYLFKFSPIGSLKPKLEVEAALVILEVEISKADYTVLFKGQQQNFFSHILKRIQSLSLSICQHLHLSKLPFSKETDKTLGSSWLRNFSAR